MTSRRLPLVLAALLVLAACYLAACTTPHHQPGTRPTGPQSSGASVGASGGQQTAIPLGSASPDTSAGPLGDGWWHPGLGLTWQWQLVGVLDTSVRVDVYDLDAFTTLAATVAALRSAGRHTICYVNVGAREDFRPDAGRFPASVVGNGLEGWPGERWLDIRRWDVLVPILTARFATCRGKGFDAVEPDNADAYSNQSGFPLTQADQLAFNRRVAELAHRMNLAVGLKNDVEQAAALAPAFDFAVNEECAKYHECERLRVFVGAGKPVFHVEYDLATGQFCPAVRALGFSSMRKRLELDAWRQPC
jgi:hypothetical protein